MALIEWNEKYSVGVKEVDRQHQKLIDMINQLHESMRLGQGKDILGPLLDDLIKYAETHFGFEEKHFEKFQYAETLAHKLEHKKFITKVTDFQTSFKKGDVSLTLDVMNFLKDWLIHHINGTDKKYTKCFNEHGLN